MTETDITIQRDKFDLQVSNMMMQRQKALQRQTQALQQLDQNDKGIIELALKPSIRNADPVDCQAALVDIISVAHALSSQAGDKQKFAFHASATYLRLMKDCPEVTLPEINAAIRNGVFGEYGDYMGLNAKSFVMFVKGYLRSEKRKIARCNYEAAKARALRSEKARLSDLQYKNWILYDYKLYKSGMQNQIFFSSEKYMLLRSLGYIEFTKKEKWFSYVIQAKHLKAEKAIPKKQASLGEQVAGICQQFANAVIVSGSEYKALVENARKLIYFKFFDIVCNEFGYQNIFEEINTTPSKFYTRCKLSF